MLMGALDIASLQQNTATAVVRFGADTINVTYRPAVATPGRIQQMMSALDDEDTDLGDFISFITELVTGWDILHGGAPLPCTTEGVSVVPFIVLRQIVQTVMQESQEVGEAQSSSVVG